MACLGFECKASSGREWPCKEIVVFSGRGILRQQRGWWWVSEAKGRMYAEGRHRIKESRRGRANRVDVEGWEEARVATYEDNRERVQRHDRSPPHV